MPGACAPLPRGGHRRARQVLTQIINVVNLAAVVLSEVMYQYDISGSGTYVPYFTAASFVIIITMLLLVWYADTNKQTLRPPSAPELTAQTDEDRSAAASAGSVGRPAQPPRGPSLPSGREPRPALHAGISTSGRAPSFSCTCSSRRDAEHWPPPPPFLASAWIVSCRCRRSATQGTKVRAGFQFQAVHAVPAQTYSTLASLTALLRFSRRAHE